MSSLNSIGRFVGAILVLIECCTFIAAISNGSPLGGADAISSGVYAGQLGGGQIVADLKRHKNAAAYNGGAAQLVRHKRSPSFEGHDYHIDESALYGQEDEEDLHHYEEQSSDSDFHLNEAIHSDFHTKPVRGIDHGKGAFSYSTLYASKEIE